MLDKVSFYLSDWMGVEKHDLLMDALKVCGMFGHTAALVAVTNLLDSATTETPATLNDEIEYIIEKGLDQVLLAHSITCDGNVRIKKHICEVLKVLDDYDDPEYIVGVCQNSSSNLDAFCTMLEYFTGRPYCEYMDSNISFSDTLIDRLVGVYQAQLESFEPSNLPDIRRRDIFLKYTELYEEPYIRKLIEVDMMRFGAPLSVILDGNKTALLSLEPNHPTGAAVMVAGFLLLSDVSLDRLVAESNSICQQYFTDVGFISLMSNHLQEIWGRVMNHG